jgi:hypothetical protein
VLATTNAPEGIRKFGNRYLYQRAEREGQIGCAEEVANRRKAVLGEREIISG